MAELTIDAIKSRSVSGVLALVSRTFSLQLIAFVATFLLTVFLSPSVFGVFYVVSAFISFLGYFSDVGLAAALIQKKEELTDDDLSSTFTIQQGLVLGLCLISWVLAPYVSVWYALDSGGTLLLYSLIVSFFLSSLKTIPSIILERKLLFGKLVIPQILETLGFYAVAVIMASRGYGIMSFTVAVFIRGLVGTVAMYIVSPWKIRIGISKDVLKRLMKFGVPFQLNSVLALLKDDLVTMVLGKVLPFEAIGYIGWAKKWAELPLRLIMDSVIRVTFPAYSRLQHDSEMLAKAIRISLFAIGSSIIPISVGLLFFVSPLVDMIPRYEKWEPAIMAFYFFTLSSAVAAFSTPLTNMLNAIGRIKITLTLMVMWTVMTWVFTFMLIPVLGFMAVPVTALILSLTIFWVIHLVKKEVDVAILSELKSPLIAALAQAVVYGTLLQFLRHTWLGLVASGVLGLIVYAVILGFWSGSRIIEVVRMGKKAQ